MKALSFIGKFLISTGNYDKISEKQSYGLKGFYMDNAFDSFNTLPPYLQPQKKSKKKAVIIIVAILCFLLIIATVVTLAVNAFKNSEVYQTAYNYFINNEFIQDTYSDDIEPVFAGGSYNKNISNGITKGDASITFKIDGDKYTVCLHIVNNKWIVCEDCTRIGKTGINSQAEKTTV